MSTKCVVSMFPGQGCQYTGMGESLFGRFPFHVRLADKVLGYSIRKLCEGQSHDLNHTEFTQPALFLVSVLEYLNRLDEEQQQSSYLIGHSLGELSALFAAGAFSFETGIAIVQARGRLMAQSTDGGMAVVQGLQLSDLEQLLQDDGTADLCIANYNSQRQFVLAGARSSIAVFESRVQKAGGKYMRLNVSGAFHSKRMFAAAEKFREFLSLQTFYPLKQKVISNVTAKCYPADSREVLIDLLARQLHSPVCWWQSILALPETNEVIFQEYGPKPVVTRLAQEILQTAST